ncbi:hypothetical protein Mapa_009171 [Marchantia paleacea]|nr:hypothetical protein Mapa_009171 [Marchantia paleacea]
MASALRAKGVRMVGADDPDCALSGARAGAAGSCIEKLEPAGRVATHAPFAVQFVVARVERRGCHEHFRQKFGRYGIGRRIAAPCAKRMTMVEAQSPSRLLIERGAAASGPGVIIGPLNQYQLRRIPDLIGKIWEFCN